MKQKKEKAYGIIFICLFLGLIIYANLREQNLPVHDILRKLGILNILQIQSESTNLLNFPQWIVSSLPDGLWMFALSLSILTVWNFKWEQNSIIWFFSALVIGILHECFQFNGYIPGTFDVVDLVFIIVGGFISMMFINKQ